MAARHYGALEISELGIYTYNDMVLLGGNDLLQSHLSFQKVGIPSSLHLYFISLGAIFFQYNIYAGILIAVALFLNSRISFVLSLLGFYSALAYYQFIGANMGELNYGYIGFNFILSAIAIGGYFIIPSVYSFGISVLLIPILSILVTGSSEVLAFFHLSTFSLPFNVVVISFLLALRFRERNFRKPELVQVQQFSPEKNLYANLNFYKRFGDHLQIPMALPIIGNWIINQAHAGKYTHKESWQHAWDFVIEEEGLEYKGDGSKLEDYYCYNKPAVAPADGEIVELIDLYLDNELGNVDLVHNWGNSLVIRHAPNLYSQMSHLKMGSFRVYKGQYVRKGEVLALVGNSGRSPFPHLHFQLQSTPYIGSKTLNYPLGPYIVNNEKQAELVQGGIPKLKDLVCNIQTDKGLKQAFRFIPGQEIQWTLKSSSDGKQFGNENLKWLVGVDFYNQTYIYSATTDSYAYFKSKDDELIFTSYEGDKTDPLYWFYLSAFHLIFGYYKQVKLQDDLPVPISKAWPSKVLQDLIAPFYIFIRPTFEVKYLSRKQFLDNSEITLKSQFTDSVLGKNWCKVDAEFHCVSDENMQWKLTLKNRTYEFTRILE
jgi:murein DD-endopeptidase MepM/ murein hydrolase activator NlpD